jgi:precorrin-3B methylase
MVALARAGRRVVRLSGGDAPSVARAEAEIAACRTAGFAVETVPVIPPLQGQAGRAGSARPGGDNANFERADKTATLPSPPPRGTPRRKRRGAP